MEQQNKEKSNQGKPQELPEGINNVLGSYIAKKLNHHQSQTEDNRNLGEMANKLKGVILRRINHALTKIYKNDYCLIKNKMNERTICCRLAIFLSELFKDFKGYYIDTEYYRGTVPSNEMTNKRSQRILCDLLLHSRRQYDDLIDNLLAIEVKLFDHENNVESDIHRLYEFALPKTPNTPKDAIHDTLLTLFIRLEESGYTICEVKNMGFQDMSNQISDE